jgi:hypothetical protein
LRQLMYSLQKEKLKILNPEN